jgi:hypothetical protein
MLFFIGAAVAAGLATMPSAPADRRLTAQAIRGTSRVCQYGSGRGARLRRIGLGEPCPFYYHEPAAAPQLVPGLALRAGEERQRGRTICVYRYGNQYFRTALAAALSCPLTPGPAMVVLDQRPTSERNPR